MLLSRMRAAPRVHELVTISARRSWKQYVVQRSVYASAWRGLTQLNCKSQATSPDQTKTQYQVDDLTSIKIPAVNGHDVYYIKRSYPKGKPEKLISGLERLLAPFTLRSDSERPTPNRHTWALSRSGDALHRVLILSKAEHLDKLILAINQESDILGHHPHYSLDASAQGQGQGQSQQQRYLFAITCTTHVPHGLSLKDVKLAERLNHAIDHINAEKPGAVGHVDGVAEVTAERLIRENEDAAEAARANSDSVCRQGA